MLDVLTPKWAWNSLLFLLLAIAFLQLCVIETFASTASSYNQKIYMSTICGRKRANQINRVIEGAVLISENDQNLDCAITFQTDSALQKFMLRFEKLSLDCSDHLYIYDDETTHSKHTFDLSCLSTHSAFKKYLTNANHVTLKYNTHSSSRDNGFRLILTAFKNTKNCPDFRCQNGYCIDKALTCDGYNHCSDNSDESHHAFCQEDDSIGKVLGLGVGIFIAVVVGVFVICFVFIISITMCICKSRALGRRRRPPPPPPMTPTCQNSATPTMTGSTPAAAHNQQGLQHFSSQPGYIPATDRGMKSHHHQYLLEKSPPPLPPHRRPHLPRPLPPSYPENWYHHQVQDPGEIAYNVHQQSLYYPTKQPVIHK